MRLIWALILFTASVTFGRSSDQKLIETARTHYNKAQYQKAVDVYSKIDVGSDAYVDAVEEKAQALGRIGRFADALAELKSVFAPPFAHSVSPEAFSTAAITHLKICDYAGVLETTKAFQKAFTPRLQNLKAIATSLANPLIDQVWSKVQGKTVSTETLGPLVTKLPRLSLRSQALRKTQKSRTAFQQEIIALAKAEIKDVEKVAGLLNIAEVEVEQRLNVLEENGKRQSQGQIQSSSDVLVFPADSEVWIDEIGHFKAQINTCPNMTRRAGL